MNPYYGEGRGLGLEEGWRLGGGSGGGKSERVC